MRLDASQHLRLEQQMRLVPRIIQAMEILQLPMMALQERIEAELQSNPVLEMRPDDPLADAAGEQPAATHEAERGERDLVVKESGSEDDFGRLADFVDEFGDGEFGDPSPAPRHTGERDPKLDAMNNTPAPVQTLCDYLLEQWMFVEADEPTRQAGRLIINNIDDDGYLRTPLEELSASAETPATVEQLRAALKLVQGLEPVGVGARDLRECLLLQLSAESAAGADVALQTELVSRYLADIENNRLPHIARRLGRPVEQIAAAIADLARLNPRPGRLVGRSSAPLIVPDVVVDVDDAGNIVATMTRGNSPRLYISRDYRRMARDRGVDRQARQFLRDKMRSAQWLMGAIEQRRDTVRRVTEEVFKVQREFLEHGAEALRPLPMADVARKVGVHVATVSRAVSGKYVQTARGIFPLRMFFSAGTTTAQGQDVSWDAVKVKLKELIDAEDKSAPLDDEKLAQKLSAAGIKLSRRTVVKYRDQMGIPTARQRKRFGAT
jgi:RNA polymerase sigma-54 factor